MAKTTAAYIEPHSGPAHQHQLTEPGYQDIAEAMPQQVWTAQPNGDLDYVNAQVVAYFFRKPEDLLRDGWLDVVHPDDRESTVTRWLTSLQTGDLYEVEFRLRRASDGAWRWHLGRAVAVWDDDGKIVKWIGTNTDVHDRKTAEEQARRASVAANAASNAKSRFLAQMSHELRTPLNAVQGYSELIEEELADRDAGDVIDYVHRIRDASGHLLGLITEILDLAQIEAGQSSVTSAEFSVEELTRTIVNTARPLVERNGNRFLVEIASEPGSMKSDAARIRQCLLNLLSNAGKFTRGGTVTLAVSREGGAVRYEVADSGAGMSSEQVSRLFEPFTQVHTDRRVGGTGLGLAITRRLCELLGGTVSVISEFGVGSRFTMLLPAELPAGRSYQAPVC